MSRLFEVVVHPRETRSVRLRAFLREKGLRIPPLLPRASWEPFALQYPVKNSASKEVGLNTGEEGPPNEEMFDLSGQFLSPLPGDSEALDALSDLDTGEEMIEISDSPSPWDSPPSATPHEMPTAGYDPSKALSLSEATPPNPVDAAQPFDFSGPPKPPTVEPPALGAGLSSPPSRPSAEPPAFGGGLAAPPSRPSGPPALGGGLAAPPSRPSGPPSFGGGLAAPPSQLSAAPTSGFGDVVSDAPQTSRAEQVFYTFDLSSWGFMLKVSFISQKGDPAPLQILEDMQFEIGNWIFKEVQEPQKLSADPKYDKEIEQKLLRHFSTTMSQYPVVTADLIISG